MSLIEDTAPTPDADTGGRDKEGASAARGGTRPGLRDLLLAGGAGLLVALSPLTSREVIPSLALGALVAGAVLVYRRRHVATFGASVESTLPGRDWLALGAVVVALVAVLWPTLTALGHQWTSSLWSNGHGLFIPPAVAYLAWRALQDMPGEKASGSAWGFLVLLPALSMVVLGTTTGSVLLATTGVVATLPAFALLLWGTRGFRVLLLPLAVSPLMIPIPDAIGNHMYLRQITASAVSPLFSGLGFLHLREGTVIQTPGQIFVIADACSGFSTLYASLSVALILGAMGGSLRLGLLLLLAAVPLALAANILRVLFLIVGTELVGVRLLESPLHPASGMATFFISLGGLFFLYERGRERTAP